MYSYTNDISFKYLMKNNLEYFTRLLSSITGINESKLKKGIFIDLILINDKEKFYEADLIYKVDDNTIINIEAYNYNSRYIMIKDFNYLCSIFSQYCKDNNHNYKNYLHIIQIVFTKNFVLSKNLIDKEYLYHRKYNKEIHKIVTRYTINLDLLGHKAYNGINKELIAYLAFLKANNSIEREKIASNNSILEEIYKNMLYYDEKEGCLVRDPSVLWKSELNACREDSLNEGKAIGLKVGKDIGLKAGKNIGQETANQQVVLKMAESGLSEEQMYSYTGISKNFIRKVLEKKLSQSK